MQIVRAENGSLMIKSSLEVFQRDDWFLTRGIDFEDSNQGGEE